MYAENLKKIRKELDISAAKLAKQLNVSQGAIMQYEHKIRTPNYNFMFQLNSILNINLNWFVTGEGEMFNNKSTGNNIKDFQAKVDEVLKNRGLI